MKKKGTLSSGYSLIIGLVLILMAWGIWEQYKAHFIWKDTLDNGVITVAKVLHYEPSEYGSDLLLEVYMGDRKFTTIVDDDCDECVGKYYFVKALKEDPLKSPLIYPDNPVPDCILSRTNYFEGWKDIPTCDESVGQRR